MSGKAQTNWVAMLSVAAISAAIGFGAVYAMVASSDNQAAPEAQKLGRNMGKQVARQLAVEGRGQEIKQTVADAERAERAKAEAVAVAQGPGRGPKGPDGAPLNRGRMATFVFKSTPEGLPDDLVFNDGKGEAVGIDRFQGKVVLMNLWATWCAPCRKEMPDLDKLQAELGGDGFEVVAVSLDRGKPDKARAFLDEIGIKSLQFYHDPNARLGFKLMAIGMPTTLLIDAKGREVGRLVGPAEWHSDDAKKLIKAVLAAQER